MCYRHLLRFGPASYVHVCDKWIEISGIYNLLSDVCVSSLDVFESLKLPPFGIGDLLYRFESNENCCEERNNDMM